MEQQKQKQRKWYQHKAWGIASVILWVLILWVGLFWDQFDLWHDHSHQYPGTFDDSEYEKAPFRTQSDSNTTEIDKKLRIRVEELMKEEKTSTKINYQSRIAEICTDYYADICSMIEYKKDFSAQQKYMYTTFLVYIFSQIDDNVLISNYIPLRTHVGKVYFDLNNEDPRWLAGHHNMKINVRQMRTAKELFEVLIHETGHLFDLGSLVDTSWKKSSKFLEFWRKSFWENDHSIKLYQLSRDSSTKAKNSAHYTEFPTSYGTTNVNEEFAEFFNTFLTHQALAIKIAKSNPVAMQKYQFFREIFGKFYMFADIETYKTFDEKIRVYDSTAPRVWSSNIKAGLPKKQ